MANDPRYPDRYDEEFARKMALFEDGPETTNFEQLLEAGIQLPEPDAIPDAALRAKLWEVIAALAELRVYLNQTDHLSDRDLYATLWHEILRTSVPAKDEIGFNCHVDPLLTGSVEDTQLYLKYYADGQSREQFKNDNPGYELPAPEEPPFNRDWLLPQPPSAPGPEAREWLRAHWVSHAFASNRFATTTEALEFVERLYAAQAKDITVGNVLMLPNHDWAPYADTLIVVPPDDPASRRDLFDLIEEVGRPDEEGGEPLIDHGQQSVRLWWD